MMIAENGKRDRRAHVIHYQAYKVKRDNRRCGRMKIDLFTKTLMKEVKWNGCS